MPTIGQSAAGQHAEVISGIYIARGNDTLGPYNSLEAAALVIGGYLRLDDYAARNGDTSWCALADFLPLSAVSRPAEPLPGPVLPASAGETHPRRWKPLAVILAVLLAIALLVAGGVRWLERPRTAVPVAAAPAPVLMPVPVPLPSVTPPPPPAAEVVHPAVAEPAPTVADGPVNGSLSFTLPQTEPVSLAGVRVSAYPLSALEPALAQETADAQATRARLDPQIEAAARDRAARAAEAATALKAWHGANPADPMITSLRFASQGAKAAAKTAGDDYRYLSDERETAAGGGMFFQGLPMPEVSADTDAEGHFTLTIPPGTEPYAVAASVRRMADDGVTRIRYWLLRLSPAQRAGREPLRLEDGNASSSSAAESLIHTAD